MDNYKVNIWNGREEFKSVMKFFDPELFCVKEKKINSEAHMHIYKYTRRLNYDYPDDDKLRCFICLDEFPLFIIRTTKKKAELYLTVKNLPDFCSFQFTKVNKSAGYGIKRWIWNGRNPNTNNYEKKDFNNLSEIIEKFINLNVLP